MNRELDLGRLMQTVGRRMAEEGQATSQRFHDWKRVEQIPKTRGSCADCAGKGWLDGERCELCRGTGDGGVVVKRHPEDKRLDRQAAKLASEWTRVKLQLEQIAKRAEYLMDQAKAERHPLDKHRTPAQVEADGWCGSHWRIGELVPVSLRSTGEPYYKGRCRPCGSWPDGDPPLEVLKTWRDGKTLRVRAS